MIKEITIKELRENFRTVRFYLILVLTIVLFAASSIIFVRNHEQKLSDYRNDISENENRLKELSKDLCRLARSSQSFVKKPNVLEFVSEAKEKYLPNKFEANIFYVYFPMVEGRGNVLLREFKNIDWEFIVAVVLSFLAFVLSYDAVCGEKEQKTLSLICSNSLKITHVFLGKFFGLLISLSIPFIVGIVIGLIILNFSAEIFLDYGRIALFVFFSFVYLSLFLLVGMTVSSIFSQSVTSAIALLFIWVVSAFVIPASGNLIAHKVHSVPTKAQIEEKIQTTQIDIYKTKYSQTRAGHVEETSLRSQFEEDKINARNRIYDDYQNQMIRQVEKTKIIMRISPVSVFRYLIEEISGTGVSRFKNFYSQVKQYMRQMYDFVEIKDKQDPKSAHLIPLAHYIGMGVSHSPVEFSSIPKFEEKLPELGDNIKQIIVDLAILTFLSIIFFFLGYILFVRYDKR